MARRLASFVRFYEYDESRFFRADGAPDDVAARRRAASCDLSSALCRQRFAKTVALTDARRPKAFPTCSSRLPTGCRFSSAACVRTASEGGHVPAIFGRRYRHGSRRQQFSTTSPAPTASTFLATIFTRRPWRAALNALRALGPVLGPYHPVVADNVKRLKRISGLDEVSFHMSGTEAVMQAVRLARYHTRRTHLVRFCGAYHGWWGDVQPGIGNPLPAHETYTLQGHVGGFAARAADAARYRLRAGQSAAGAASQHECAGGLVAGRQRTHGAFRQTGLCRMAQAAARGLHRAKHRADFRRSVCRLSTGHRRRAGIFRRPRRSRHLWQDARRRTADRRGVRAQGLDAAFPRRSSRPTSALPAARSIRIPT